MGVWVARMVQTRGQEMYTPGIRGKGSLAHHLQGHSYQHFHTVCLLH